jgi:exopolysaccharide production protein ExoQ
MITASHTLSSSPTSATQPLFRFPLQWVVGFFFSFRFAVTYIAFQANPRAGTITIMSCSALLLAASAIYTFGDSDFSIRSIVKNLTLRWLLAYLLLSGVSLSWTAAESLTDAAGLWMGMLIESATVFLLLWGPAVSDRIDALFQGYISGVLALAVVAWTGPTLPDLRIGDYDFLHPNMIGMNCALAFLLARHLIKRQRAWAWACLALAMTLLRSISKTSIIALCIAEGIHLIRETSITTKRKIQIISIVMIVTAMFASLLGTYIQDYATLGSGTQVETLTGRTAIWATAFFLAIEKPWIGHGFYSLRALMPAFDNGNFEPWHAHNELLQEFFEYGVLGIIVTIGTYRSLFYAAKRVLKSQSSSALATSTLPNTAPPNSLRSYHKLVTVILLFTIIHGLTESMNFGLTIPLWLFAALAIALEQQALEAARS